METTAGSKQHGIAAAPVVIFRQYGFAYTPTELKDAAPKGLSRQVDPQRCHPVRSGFRVIVPAHVMLAARLKSEHAAAKTVDWAAVSHQANERDHLRIVKKERES